MYVPPVAMETVPWAGVVFAVTVRLEPASLVRTDVPLYGVFALVRPLLLLEVGVTVIETVDVEERPEESVVV